ncbi:thioredoxin-dependent thiol peroxidase [Clostridium massiliamazoniense]|uniref:thioredoxin-dependent thiol peroxidase n=1 Tax=Clostridium massiliamazoniense TaxID=1347366 RepID=UPI0006D7E232|nr:thioredoxin-dependent thiol peroxidase [Clostridium massiliamazoniense]
MLEIGKKAPDFKIIGSDNKEHSLSDYLGKTVILYFYPKDNTPGCTTEACDFRDNSTNFEDKNAIIIGVSRDSVKTHSNFISKFQLPFLLLSDKEEELCKLYDVIKEKKLYGKTYMGIERSTFIINPEGILTHEFRKVKVKNHVDEILALL